MKQYWNVTDSTESEAYQKENFKEYPTMHYSGIPRHIQ